MTRLSADSHSTEEVPYDPATSAHAGVFCLSPRKGPFQTLVKQKPEFLYLALFPFKTGGMA